MSDFVNFSETLGQSLYKDENGQDIAADRVRALAPYRHIADGFYNWQCGHCCQTHNGRAGWAISGQVLRCESCDSMNLLVRTNCIEIDTALAGKWRSVEMEQENERLKNIRQYNEQQLVILKREILAQVARAVNSEQMKLIERTLATKA